MNHFGRIFRIGIFGESHGDIVGVVIDGCPSGIPILPDDFLVDIERRKGGKTGTTSRTEEDIPQIVSGVYNNLTTGSPLTLLFKNENKISEDYKNFLNHPRPGHADFTAFKKYNGFNDPRGGGHFSGRLTLPLVAAGVIAKKIIREVQISARIIEAGGSSDIENKILEAVSNGDSMGGIVECVADGIPVGWGEPFFDSVESVISHLAFSVPAIKGVEFGLGFQSSKINGSQMNDVIIDHTGKTKTNNSGGISGGITNGNQLLFRVAVKPTSSISVSQETLDLAENKMREMKITGRHDSCIALRVPVIIESITAIALADFKLLFNSKINC